MLPCGENVTIEECPKKPNVTTKGIKALRKILLSGVPPKKMMLRKSPTAIVCNTAELAAKITDFNDQDRYLIGKVCQEESSIHKYSNFDQKFG